MMIPSVAIRFLMISIVMTLGFGLSSCAYNEETGKRNFNFITTEEEIELGKSADPVIKKQYGVYEDLDLQSYVDGIGQRIAAFSGRDDIPYHFTVLDSPIINAFALPGGYIYVTRGLLAQLNSEAELAFVIGHEISHVSAKHGAQRLSQQKTAAFASIVAALLLQDNENSQEITKLVNTGVNLAVLGYGRDNEFEADQLGAKYAYAAQYDPREFSAFFHTLKRQEKYQSTWLEQLQSSHPPTTERIIKVGTLVDSFVPSQNTRFKGYDLDRNRYLKQIKRIYMGKGRQLGQLTETGLYENYPYRFSMLLPVGWKLFKSESPAALLDFKHSTMPIYGDLSILDPVKFVELKDMARPYFRSELKKLSHQRLSYLKEPAYQTKYRVEYSEFGKAVEIATYFKQGSIGYRFAFYVKQQFVRSYENEVMAIVKRFAFMSSEQQREAGVYQLLIHEVISGETLASISKRYLGESEGALPRLKAFNGLSGSSNSALTVGDFIVVKRYLESLFSSEEIEFKVSAPKELLFFSRFFPKLLGQPFVQDFLMNYFSLWQNRVDVLKALERPSSTAINLIPEPSSRSFSYSLPKVLSDPYKYLSFSPYSNHGETGLDSLYFLWRLSKSDGLFSSSEKAVKKRLVEKLECIANPELDQVSSSFIHFYSLVSPSVDTVVKDDIYETDFREFVSGLEARSSKTIAEFVAKENLAKLPLSLDMMKIVFDIMCIKKEGERIYSRAKDYRDLFDVFCKTAKSQKLEHNVFRLIEYGLQNDSKEERILHLFSIKQVSSFAADSSYAFLFGYLNTLLIQKVLPVTQFRPITSLILQLSASFSDRLSKSPGGLLDKRNLFLDKVKDTLKRILESELIQSRDSMKQFASLVKTTFDETIQALGKEAVDSMRPFLIRLCVEISTRCPSIRLVLHQSSSNVFIVSDQGAKAIVVDVLKEFPDAIHAGSNQGGASSEQAPTVKPQKQKLTKAEKREKAAEKRRPTLPPSSGPSKKGQKGGRKGKKKR